MHCTCRYCCQNEQNKKLNNENLIENLTCRLQNYGPTTMYDNHNDTMKIKLHHTCIYSTNIGHYY